MEDQKHTTSFTFEIDNYSEKEKEKEPMIKSESFSSGGCEWDVTVFPKGVLINDDSDNDYMYLYLHVKNTESLRLGWKIRASFSFFVLNQSLKELCRLDEPCQVFYARYPGWGCYAPREKLQELEKNSKLIIKVQVKVFEVVDVRGVTGNEMLELKEKHDEIYLERKKAKVDGVQESEEHMIAKETKAITCAAKDWFQGVVQFRKVKLGFADVVAKEKID